MDRKGISIRPAEMADLDRIMEVLGAAKAFMRSTGNMGQWINGYPSRDMMAGEITLGHCYVIEVEGRGITATFCMIKGDDPTYSYIEGSWLSDSPYVTIHRLGSDGSVKGMGKVCFDYAMDQGVNVRVDTHADNRPMQNLVTSYGFSYCGIIYLENGDPRLAYEMLNNK